MACGPTKSPVVSWLNVTMQLLGREEHFFGWEHGVLSKSCEANCGVTAMLDVYLARAR